MKTKRQCRKLYRRLLIASGHRSYRSANRRRGQLIGFDWLARSEREERVRLEALTAAAIAWECFDAIRARNVALAKLERLAANCQNPAR